MLVKFPFFAAGINYFPGEISALRVFEPRYLLLIGDSIVNSKSFLVGRNMEELGQVVSEVEILEHQDISNAEQLVVIECKNLYKIKERTHIVLGNHDLHFLACFYGQRKLAKADTISKLMQSKKSLKYAKFLMEQPLIFKKEIVFKNKSSVHVYISNSNT